MKEISEHVVWSEQTKRAYKMDWNSWEQWAVEQGVDVLPADSRDVIKYAKTLFESGMCFISLQRRMVVIGRAHELAKEPNNPIKKDLFRLTMMEMRFAADAPANRKYPVIDEQLRTIIDNIAHEHLATETRDKAIILLLHATKLRRSELAALTTNDLQFLSDGRLEITMMSGTNRYHKSQSQILIEEHEEQDYCPIHALESWLTILNISAGPLFRPVNRHGNIQETTSMSGRSIDNAIIKWTDNLSPSSFRNSFEQ